MSKTTAEEIKIKSFLNGYCNHKTLVINIERMERKVKRKLTCKEVRTWVRGSYFLPRDWTFSWNHSCSRCNKLSADVNKMDGLPEQHMCRSCWSEIECERTE